MFVYGLDLASQGMEKAFVGWVRPLLSLFTRNRCWGLLIGIFLTVCFQSSGATTVVLVGLVKAGILNLQQTLGVILGADIGTTLTIQLIAFKFDYYSLLIFALGAILYFLGKYEKTKNMAKAVMGFGLLFYGMVLMKQGMAPLRHNAAVVEGLLACARLPWAMLLASMVLTALIHSSAATIAVAMALVAADGGGAPPLLTFATAVPILFGANIGTCSTALLAAWRADRKARQVALAHLFFKVAAVALVFPFLPLFIQTVQGLSEWLTGRELSDVRLLANAHTFFNVAAALVFLPFTQWVPPLLEMIYPKRGREGRGAQTLILNEQLTKTPSLALDQADAEIQKLGQEVDRMLDQVIVTFQKEDSYLVEDVWRADQKVDQRYAALSKYLSRLGQADLSEADTRRLRDSFLLIEELEHIGDIVSRNLVPLATKKLERGVDFSVEGFHDIIKLHERVSAALEQVLQAHGERKSEPAHIVLARKNEISDLAYQMRLNHLERLKRGLKESLETSSIHLDILSSLLQIYRHVVGMARVLVREDKSQGKSGEP